MRPPNTVAALAELGCVRLSRSFFLRDILFSDTAAIHGLANVPDDPDLAIAAGTRLCEDLLESLQDAFGRLAIRSAYRSCEVNGLGSAMQAAGKAGYACASNESNWTAHIWDRRDTDGRMGATACIVVPRFRDRLQETGDWQRLAWWIHDHLPCSTLYFFPECFAFDIGWHQRPERAIHSYAAPRGCPTRPGLANHACGHEGSSRGIAD